MDYTDNTNVIRLTENRHKYRLLINFMYEMINKLETDSISLNDGKLLIDFYSRYKKISLPSNLSLNLEQYLDEELLEYMFLGYYVKDILLSNTG